jgi:hypothetical protein
MPDLTITHNLIFSSEELAEQFELVVRDYWKRDFRKREPGTRYAAPQTTRHGRTIVVGDDSLALLYASGLLDDAVRS